MAKNSKKNKSKKESKVLFGPGGTAGLGYEVGLDTISDKKLDALEVEFTYGVKMSNEKAKNIGNIAKEKGIKLSVHAPYWVNLASVEKHKITASKRRILKACERAHHLGAKCVVFHPAFYGKRDKDEVFEMVESAVKEMKEIIDDKNWNVNLCPETTGKVSQFGTVDELIELSQKTGCGICVDFSHVYARANGRIDYDNLFKKLKKQYKHIHGHFSGIEFGEKGEKKHKDTEDERIQEFVKYLKKHDVSATIINEAPHPIKDARRMKDAWESSTF